MILDDVKKEQLKYDTRDYAGLEGFDFYIKKPDGRREILATVFNDDLAVANAIHTALKDLAKDEDG